VRLDSSIRWAIPSICYPLQARKTRKRYSSIMSEKYGGTSQVYLWQLVSRYLWTWHVSVSCLYLGIRFSLSYSHHHGSSPWPRVRSSGVYPLFINNPCCQVLLHAVTCSKGLHCLESFIVSGLRCVSTYSIISSSYHMCRFRVDDVGIIMAHLRRVYSCRHQITIRELDLEINH